MQRDPTDLRRRARLKERTKPREISEYFGAGLKEAFIFSAVVFHDRRNGIGQPDLSLSRARSLNIPGDLKDTQRRMFMGDAIAIARQRSTRCFPSAPDPPVLSIHPSKGST
jgi:hypothetical protein